MCVMALTLQPVRSCSQHSGETGTDYCRRFRDVLAWVSGLPTGLGEKNRWGRGEREKRKEGLTQNHSANRVTHPKSGCGSDWITHNTPWRHRPQERSARRRSLKFFIDVLISCYRYVILLQTETQRGMQKGSRGRSQVLSWNKIKPEQELCFQGLVV